MAKSIINYKNNLLSVKYFLNEIELKLVEYKLQ